MKTPEELTLVPAEERLSFRLTVALPLAFALLSFVGSFGAMMLTNRVFRPPAPSAQDQLLLQLWMLGAPVLAGVAGFLVASRITRPLRRAIRDAQAMLRRALVEPSPIAATTELGAFSAVFDQALVSFAELVLAREILDNLTEGVLAVDREGKVAGMNRRAQELFGVSPTDTRGRPLNEVVGSAKVNGTLLTVAKEVMAKGEERTRHGVRFVLPTGAEMLMAVKGTPLRHNGQDPIGAVLVLKERVQPNAGHPGIVGRSEALTAVLEIVARVAPTDAPALVLGESGTGKELIAEALHQQSRRKDRPLVKLNCAAIPEGLLESELFGHERGAFTGALRKKPGKFEQADGGTLFLDEIGDMSLALQAKILRVLQDGEVVPVGGVEVKRVDVRVIAASNKDLPREVQAGRFREDLYHRLNVVAIILPPLRERYADLPLLADYFLPQAAERLGTQVKSLSREALERLLAYSWPGNVRELRNVLERAVLLADGPVIHAPDLVLEGLSAPRREAPGEAGVERWPNHGEVSLNGASLKETLQAVERGLILQALQRAGGVQVEAAKLLGIEPKNLWHKVRKHGIDARELKGAGEVQHMRAGD